MGFFGVPSALDPRGKGRFPDPFTQAITGMGANGGGSPQTAMTGRGPDAYGNLPRGNAKDPYWQNAYGIIPSFMGNYGGAFPGVNTLYDILNNPGQTDSRLFNMSLGANARATQANQASAQSGLARSGFGGSGLGAALQASIGQAGANQAGTLYANEARRREDLKRSDLDLLRQFFINPKVQMYGANKGVQIAADAAKQQKQGAEAGASAALIAAIIAAAACHTADELYGVGSPEAWASRTYMAFEASPETLRLYGTEGGSVRLAARIRKDPELRREVRGIFDTFVERGNAILGK